MMGSENSVSPGPRVVFWQTLLTDRWAQSLLATFAGVALLYLLPVLDDAQRALLSRAVAPLVFLTLIVAALLHCLDRLSAPERRFWQDVIGAFSALLVIAMLYLFFPRTEQSLPLSLAVEALHAAFYTALVLAVERQPHRTYRWRPTQLERILAWPAVGAFIVALFAYFTILPLLAGATGTDRWTSSFTLYLALDVYLTARFLWLSRQTAAPRWRTLYLVLGLTTGAVFASDLLKLSWFQMVQVLSAVKAPTTWGSGLDLVYLAPYLVLILARARHFEFRDPPAAQVGGERPETHFTRPSGRTIVHALVFPLLHFGGYRFGWFHDAYQVDREALVFWAILGLGAIAVIQHRMLEKRARQLWQDREDVEATLRRNEKDLRMMVERYHTDQKLRLSEEKLAKAFRACPDAMMISSLADGKICEINDSFELTTGYCQEDILGKTTNEVGLWADPEARQSMIQKIEVDGVVRNFEVRFRTRSGSVRIGLVSVEKLNIDGEPHLLSVTRDITERRRIENKLKTQAVLLDKAQDAIAVLDLEDRVTYWNRSAERLYGWSAAEALGRPAVELLHCEGCDHALEASRDSETGDWIGELRPVTKDGAEVVVESWWSLVRDQDGNPESKLVVFSNVDRKADALPS